MSGLNTRLAVANVLGSRPGFDWTKGPFVEADDEELARLLLLLGWEQTEHDPAMHRKATGTLRRALNQLVNLAEHEQGVGTIAAREQAQSDAKDRSRAFVKGTSR